MFDYLILKLGMLIDNRDKWTLICINIGPKRNNVKDTKTPNRNEVQLYNNHVNKLVSTLYTSVLTILAFTVVIAAYDYSLPSSSNPNSHWARNIPGVIHLNNSLTHSPVCAIFKGAFCQTTYWELFLSSNDMLATYS